METHRRVAVNVAPAVDTLIGEAAVVKYEDMNRSQTQARRIGEILEGAMRVQSLPIDLRYLRARRDEILAVARRRRAKSIQVFGSVARGSNTEQSDVDFLVEMEDDATLIDLIGLEQDLEALLGCEVDVVTEDSVSPLMRESPAATAVRL